jgi:diacylglycerol kinase family enzyme
MARKNIEVDESINMKPPCITVILNASAGVKTGESLRERLIKDLEQQGARVDLHIVEHGKGMTELAKSAVEGGAMVVVAGGGDGTVNAVASALVDTECALGVLPTGTLNHFAKDLGIPLDLEKASEVIALGVVRKVDVGEVNGRIFVNNSSLGLYPKIVRGREEVQRLGRGKWTALFWSTLAVLRHYPMLTVGLSSTKGGPFKRRTPLVFVGNNEYEMKGFEIGSRPRLDGGKLAVYVAPKDGPAALLRMGVAAVFGMLRRGVDFDFLATEKLRVDATRKTIQVATDGEVRSFVPPLLYRIRPLALKVIAPAKT